VARGGEVEHAGVMTTVVITGASRGMGDSIRLGLKNAYSCAKSSSARQAWLWPLLCGPPQEQASSVADKLHTPACRAEFLAED